MHMAPVVLRTRNLRVMVYPRDHKPPHVHVKGPGREARFNLKDLRCVSARGFSFAELAKLKEFLNNYRDLLLET